MTITFQGTLEQMEALRTQADLLVGGVPRKGTGPGIVASVCPTGDCPGWTKTLTNPPTLVTGSVYKLELPDLTKSVLGRVPDDRKRIVVLGIGESGIVGIGALADSLPAGYPKIDGSCWNFDNAGKWGPLIEPTSEPQAPIPSPGVSFAGMFCWRLQTLLGAAFEVAYLPCALGGSKSTDWAVGGVLYSAAKARALAALAQPRTVLGCVLLEQGINDAIASIQSGWAARWSAIETQLRADLGNTIAPIYFSQDTLAVSSFTTAPNWSALRAEKAAWAGARRFLVQKPNGPFVDSNTHLTTAAQSALASLYLDAWIANPGVTS